MLLNDMERLAIAQSVYNVVGDFVSMKEPGSLRYQMDAEVCADFANDGIKSRDVRVNGEKVGTYTVRTAKPKTIERTFIDGTAEFALWVAENPELATQFAMERAVEFADFVIAETGELPDGVTLREEYVPERVLGATLKVDEHKVAQAMGAALPNAVMGLLGGEE